MKRVFFSSCLLMYEYEAGFHAVCYAVRSTDAWPCWPLRSYLEDSPLACKAVSGLARDFLTFKHLTLECSPTSSIRYGCSLHLSPFTFLESCPGPCPGPCLLPWAPPSLCTPSHPAWVLLPPCRLSVCCLEVGPWASPAVCVRPSQTLGPVGLPPATDAFFTGFSVCSCLFLFYGNVRLRWSSPCPTIRDK